MQLTFVLFKDLEEFKAKNPPLPKKVFQQFKLPFLRRLLDPTSFNFADKYVNKWNKHIDQLAKDEKVVRSLENLFDSNVTIASLKLLLMQVVAKLNANHPKIEVDDVTRLANDDGDDKVKLMTGLSVLEICLLIAIKHHCDIYDNDPFNFEMILTRFNKFVIKSSTMQNIDREMVLKRFENLKYQEFIVPIGVEGKVQKEYQMHKMLLFADQVDKAVQKYQNLPTEIEQWAKSSII
jgi:origin recognition complex subunit 4